MWRVCCINCFVCGEGSHFEMEAAIEEEVLKENVLEGRMQCLLCNVTAVNLPTWESHKKGKKWGRRLAFSVGT